MEKDCLQETTRRDFWQVGRKNGTSLAAYFIALPPREKGLRRPHKADGILYLQEQGSWAISSKDGTVLETVEMKPGQLLGVEVECTLKSDRRLSEILPDLLAHHDYVWYFCLTSSIKRAVADVRKEVLTSNEQRRRVRILLLEEYLPCL